MTAIASIEVAASVDQVWAALTDWERQGQWMPFTKVTVVAGDRGLGTRLRAVTGIGPLRVVDDMVIDVWEPPHRAEVAHHGRIVTGRGVFAAEPLPHDRSRVSWSELPSPGGFLQRCARVTDPVAQRALAVALRRFAGMVAHPA